MGDAITNDSDKDGITDYDEISLYKTNPFAADTDGDGFIDSSEITLGIILTIAILKLSLHINLQKKQVLSVKTCSLLIP